VGARPSPCCRRGPGSPATSATAAESTAAPAPAGDGPDARHKAEKDWQTREPISAGLERNKPIIGGEGGSL
jgi:hypothetical protein